MASPARSSPARAAPRPAPALELGIADRAAEDAAEAVVGADLVVIATPLPPMPGSPAHRAALRPGAIVTDVGSVKQAAIRDLKPVAARESAFHAGHPVAGTEHSGRKPGLPSCSRSLVHPDPGARRPTRRLAR